MVFGSAARNLNESMRASTVDLNEPADILEASGQQQPASFKVSESIAQKKSSTATPNGSPPKASIHFSAAPEPLLNSSMTASMLRDNMNQVSSPSMSPTHAFLPKDDVNAPFLALNPPALPLIPDHVIEKVERKRRDSNDSYASRH